MIRTKCISMFLLAAGSFAGTQVAGQTDPNRPDGRAVSPSQRKSRSEAANETFQRNDRNEDGVVTKDEAHPIFLANFDRYDVNHDGRVELEEFQKTVSQTVIPAARQNGNGDEAAIQWVTPVFSGPRLQHRVFKSEAVKCDVSYHIYVPEIYGTDKTRSFPVLYWLHGGGGPGSGSGPRRLSRHFDNAIGQGKTPPMLVVFPNGLRGGMWCDSKDGRTPIETILINELIPDVDAHFRTIASREGRMIEGFSGGATARPDWPSSTMVSSVQSQS